jgi:hypothetical protein
MRVLICSRLPAPCGCQKLFYELSMGLLGHCETWTIFLNSLFCAVDDLPATCLILADDLGDLGIVKVKHLVQQKSSSLFRRQTL